MVDVNFRWKKQNRHKFSPTSHHRRFASSLHSRRRADTSRHASIASRLHHPFLVADRRAECFAAAQMTPPIGIASPPLNIGGGSACSRRFQRATIAPLSFDD